LGELEISLKDLPPGARHDWLSVNPRDAFYIVCLDKAVKKDKHDMDSFAVNNGVLIVRGCFGYREKGKPLVQ